MFPTVEAYLGNLSFGFSFCRFEWTERQRKKMDRLFRFSRVPPNYAGKSFGEYKVTEHNERAIKAAQWVMGNGDKGLLLYGPPGTGKTLLAATAVNELLKWGWMAMFSSLPDLLNDIRTSYDKGTTADILQAINETPFLVLDDLGAERMTPWVGEQLFGLINSRLSGKRKTIITSNYSPSELIARMETVDSKWNVIDDIQGRRIMSRIHEMCYLVEMGGEDWRRKAAPGVGNG